MRKVIVGLVKSLLLVIGSWLIIHAMAVVGVFVAIAKPLWWLVFPEISICFICRIKKAGDWCSACRRKVTSDFRIYTLRSMIINSLIILAVSFMSIGFVWLEGQVLAAAGIISLQKKTVSFIIPDRLQYRLGEIFPMKLEMIGVERPINVVQADLSFNPQNLEAVMINTNDSFATIFVQKEINNETGYVRLTGGLPSPGFKGSNGLFGTVFFRGKMPGLAKVEYLPTSMVLANDGKGTNVMKNLSAVTYLILPESVSKQESEQQKSLLSQNVLGEATDGVMRMDFSQEAKVLGQEVKAEPNTIWQALWKIDQQIIALWHGIVDWLVADK